MCVWVCAGIFRLCNSVASSIVHTTPLDLRICSCGMRGGDDVQIDCIQLRKARERTHSWIVQSMPIWAIGFGRREYLYRCVQICRFEPNVCVCVCLIRGVVDVSRTAHKLLLPLRGLRTGCVVRRNCCALIWRTACTAPNYEFLWFRVFVREEAIAPKAWSQMSARVCAIK